MTKTNSTYIFILSIISIFFVTSTSAQDRSGFKQIDSLTYSAYINKNYKELFEIGEKAIKQDIDYFYLRMRLGIAHFQQYQYRLAAKHFEQALQFNSSDSLAIEYLYYSHKYSNDDLSATKCLQKSTSKKAQELSKKQTVLKNIYLFYGTRFYNSDNVKEHLLDDFTTEMDQFPKPVVGIGDTGTDLYTEITCPKTYSNIQVGANLRVLPFWQVGIAYQNFKIEHNYTIINYKDTLTNNPYKWDGIYLTANARNSIKASQFYLKNTFGILNKFKLSLFANIQSYTSSKTYDVNYINDTSIKHSNLLLGASFTFMQSFYNLNLGVSTLSTIDKPVIQSDFGVDLFPFANNKLFVSVMGTFIFDGTTKKNALIFIPSLSYTPTERLTIFGSASWGKRNNWQTNNGYVIYNGLFDINSTYKLSTTIRIYKTLYFNLEYEYLNTISNAYSTLPEIKKTNKVNFVTQSLIGGLIWEF